MVDLGTSGGSAFFPYATLFRSQVVGGSNTTGGAYHAFSWTQAGGMVDLGTLGGTYYVALGINASGQVVGESNIRGCYTLGNLYQALWGKEDGRMDDLASVGATD